MTDEVDRLELLEELLAEVEKELTAPIDIEEVRRARYVVKKQRRKRAQESDNTT